MIDVARRFPKALSTGFAIAAIVAHFLISSPTPVLAEGPPPCDCLYAGLCYSNGAQVGSQCCWNASWGGC